ncbi:Organic solvent tolerance protein OstA [Reichenbachiella carrageenanivorans]|uniref:Organic solvent tolerance protein OstA n=1 Tax=Reichenbachiella carrageenanivorans TaxID=2979869 RepID=A0ABY6CZG5_9BACT|nr:OstA-like protein [Reichenbachiella carrageenanivorans]UXX79253.1 Organic solvent tolerance protein OstA [Reichenbachiella carrageenanivorans]
MRNTFLFWLICAVTLSSGAMAQKGDKIKYKADRLTNSRQGNVRYKKLLHNVVFTQKSTTVYCDSAYFYSKTNEMEAFGRVRIVDDSVTITSKKLIYKGNEGMALLREDVVYRKGRKVLYTDILDYNLLTEVGEFKEHGKLVDEQNTLTSTYGVYHSKSSQAFFYKKVLLVSPDFNLKADTLEYSSISKIAVTKGPTYIERKDGTTVDADGGRFKTAYDQTTFDEGTIETKNYVVTGDEIFLDEKKKFYTAKGNVVMTSKKDDILIFGDKAVYDKNAGVSTVYGRPLMKRIMRQDTFFMVSDTLVSIENVDKDKERILAFHNILMYKLNMQGKCDSVAYFTSDSTIHMYNDPVIWNKNSQMESDSIDLLFKDDILKTMTLRRKAFLISIDTLGQHNQIKGRKMIGNFNEYGDLQEMDINGNGESHYFVLKGDSVMIGMNKIFCSKMTLRFKDNLLNNISFYTQPEAKFIPPHELDEEQMFLEEFDWRDDERPELYEVATYYKPGDKVTKKSVLKDKMKKMLEENKDQIDVGKKILQEGNKNEAMKQLNSAQDHLLKER